MFRTLVPYLTLSVYPVPSILARWGKMYPHVPDAPLDSGGSAFGFQLRRARWGCGVGRGSASCPVCSPEPGILSRSRLRVSHWTQQAPDKEKPDSYLFLN